MQTKIVADVIRLVLVVAVSAALTVTAQGQDTDRSAEYKAEMESIEHFNKVQREADMPEMPIPSYEEWLKAKQEAEASAVASSDTNAAPSGPTKQERMRQWLNTGLRTAAGQRGTVAQIQNERRARLWVKSAESIVVHEKQMDEARTVIKDFGLAEQGKTPDGNVLGLIGIENGMPRFNITYNAVAADTISVDELWPSGSSGLSITGSNTVMGIWDGGDVLTNHYEFVSGAASRAQDKDGTSSLPPDFHPTAVAGTMMAQGVGYAAAKGMAYLGQLWTYDWFQDLETEMNSAYANNVRLSNHSYGQQAGWGTVVLGDGSVTNCWFGDLAISGSESYLFGRYEELCSNVDAVAYGNPLSLPVWAAGNERDDAAPPAGSWYVTFTNGTPIWSNGSRPNDYFQGGFDTIADRGLAKNVLSIGAVYKIAGGYSGTGSVNIAGFSSCGPSDDGRVKPDVVATGVGLFTPILYPPDPTNPYYYTTNASGTSFSSPSAAGAVGLLVDLRKRLVPEFPYLASTLKGIILHTADDASTRGPDYRTGWGLINADTAASLVQNDHDTGGKQFIKEVSLLNSNDIEFAVTATGGVPLKVTICWTDPADAVQPVQLDPTNRVLVNDLDLRIIGPTGVTNLPWILNSSNPSNAATTGDNYRDNVEQVVITNVAAGTQYVVRVTHKGTLVDDTGQAAYQDVSIVLSGIFPETRADLAVAQAALAGDEEMLLWPSVVGQNYRVQTAIDLMNQAWTNLSAEISATKTNTAWESGGAPSGDLRFYRLIETN